MEAFNLIQGSQEWHDFRKVNLPASEAPAALGAGLYGIRTPYDLALHRLGIKPLEVTEFMQKLFDEGHEAEDKARPLVEKILNEPLSPIVGRRIVDGLPLSASLDGITFDGDTIFEHKLWNENLAQQVNSGSLEAGYYWQLEQQLLVSGAKRVVFVTSDGTYNKFAFMIYEPVAGRADALVKGWKDYLKTEATYRQDDEEWEKLVEPYVEVEREILALQTKIKELRSQINLYPLIQYLESKGLDSMAGKNYALRKSTRKGAFDENKLKQALGVSDLEMFRKDSSEFWTGELL